MAHRHRTPCRRSGAGLLQLLLVALALLVAAPGAWAFDPGIPPTPLDPADGAALPTRSSPLFRVQTQPGDSYLWLRVSRAPVTDSTGLIGAELELEPLHVSALGADLYEAQPPFYDYASFWMNQPGTYYWQVYRITYANGADGAVEGPIRSFTLAAPPSPPAPPPTPPPVPPPGPEGFPDLSLSTIPRWVAPYRRNRGFVVSRAGLPGTVTLDRWTALVTTSARRWGLRSAGQISTPVRFGNYRNEIGFSSALGRGKLGSTVATYLRRFRLVRVCGPRACRVHRKLVSRRLVDRDVAIDARRPWEQGPDYPTSWELDLQSVVIHELGHVAGNGHERYCVDSPMVVSLSRGEWWRSEDDYRWIGCGGVARAAGAGGAFDHRVRYVDVVVGTGRRAGGRA